MTKTIVITPQTMLKLIGGAKLRDMDVPVSRDARVVKSAFNEQSQEFSVTVESASFDTTGTERRLPQEFRLEPVNGKVDDRRQ